MKTADMFTQCIYNQYTTKFVLPYDSCCCLFSSG